MYWVSKLWLQGILQVCNFWFQTLPFRRAVTRVEKLKALAKLPLVMITLESSSPTPMGAWLQKKENTIFWTFFQFLSYSSYTVLVLRLTWYVLSAKTCCKERKKSNKYVNLMMMYPTKTYNSLTIHIQLARVRSTLKCFWPHCYLTMWNHKIMGQLQICF